MICKVELTRKSKKWKVIKLVELLIPNESFEWIKSIKDSNANDKKQLNKLDVEL